MTLLFAILLACAHAPAPDPVLVSEESVARPDHFVLRGGTVVGRGPADVEVRQGRIVSVGVVPEGPPIIDVAGQHLAPAFIDSHVHLAFLPRIEEMADGGVAGAVNLASPTSFLDADSGSLQLLRAGPMVTSVSGYPTLSWGRGGYGLEVIGPDDAAEAVETLHGLGVDLIKLPITGAPVLDEAALRAAVEAAHGRGLKVATHALSDADAALAAAVGCDVLAHVPTAALSDETLQAWSGRAVVGTIGAFGGGSAAVDNVRRLREAGATVLYGTDFGNTRDAGIDGREVGLLVDAGLDGAAILEAATDVPAAYWGFDELGAIAEGKAASLLVLDADPLVDPGVLARPVRVFIDGRER